MARFEFFGATPKLQVSATIGRGSGTPSTSFINLANSLSFLSQELLLAEGNGNQDNLNTSLATTYTAASSQGNTIVISYIDTPGAVETYTYATRVISSISANTLHIRQSYINVIKLFS